jgi:hypothetical protein
MVDSELIFENLRNNFRVDGKATIDGKGLVYVDGNIELLGDFHKLPVQFHTVTGDFTISHSMLTTLEGAPSHVGGNFSCWNNFLTSLAFSPKNVGGDFDCGNNPELGSLEGVPLHIQGSFSCNHCNLRSLAGAPNSVDEDFWCSHNKLKSLEGCPSAVYGSFFCGSNELTNLNNAPQTVTKNFSCHKNKLASLEGLPPKLRIVELDWWPTTPLLRTLVADEIRWWKYPPDEVVDILNKYKGQGRRGMFACKKELIEAGFEENAKW